MMKKFLWFLLLMVMFTAFAVPAAAVDVKFSGSYYAQGWYVDNPSVLDKSETPGAASWANNSRRSAAAFYSQRFRLATEFQVVEGLKLVTRFDALEKTWGDQSWAGSTGETQSRVMGQNGTAATGTKIQENIEFERAYLDFNVPFGKFQVGYMEYLVWGTPFLNTTLSAGGIRYTYNQGPWQAVAAVEKRAEYLGLAGGKAGATTGGSGYIGQGSDADRDVYDLGGIYKFKAGEAGILYQYIRSSQLKTQYINGYLTQLSGLYPYAKLTFGKLFLEGEFMYGFGDLRSYENNGGVTNAGQPTAGTNLNMAQNVSLTALGAYAHAKYDLKPAYIGAKFVYLSGDDQSNSDKATGSILQSLQMNRSFYPTLILWNDDYQNNMGNIQGNVPAGATGTNRRTGQSYAVRQEMDNVWFYQVYAGVKPAPKIDIKAALSIANADKKPKSDVGAVGSPGYYSGVNVQEFVSAQYGTELDLTASYKIYDNLTYMIGAGYLWAGDYFKGYDNSAVVSNNYLLSHKLTLTF
ncbi:MAG: hypothetical protein M0Q01_14715 [Syntrophales bacterium]|jgi:hypothetical protein|nr:hypothetical protein [Syntrophales bacterium]